MNFIAHYFGDINSNGEKNAFLKKKEKEKCILRQSWEMLYNLLGGKKELQIILYVYVKGASVKKTV